jgi:lipopolysaccharide biosynthesis protein
VRITALVRRVIAALRRRIGPRRALRLVNRLQLRIRRRLEPRRRLHDLLKPVLSEQAERALRPPLPLYEPASFDTWVIRNGSGRITGYPDHWRTRPGVIIENPARVAVLLHVYFPELVGEILDQLATIPVDFDLIVTNSSGRPVTIDTPLGRVRNIKVLTLGNHGRDIWPTVAAINSGVLDPYLVILKVHTKKSVWRAEHAELAGDGASWRQSFIDQLLGSEQNVSDILTAFRTDSSLGVVTADGSVLGPEFWGDNERNTAELARRLEMDLDEAGLRFAAGSVYWCRGIVLQGLRALNMCEADFEPESGQVNATTAHAVERLIGVVTTEAGLRTEERSAVHGGNIGGLTSLGDDTLRPRARFVPFYLPQFHPFPENDTWWGKGFTEWTNAAAARPVYHGHYQPRLPTELGFYDLRIDEVREAQAALARFGGIDGFMYYYYWFAGRRLMSRPIEALLASDLDFPFCIMWANENWTRKWDGSSSDVLIGQDYDLVPPSRFLDDIAEFLADPRYLRIEGRPVLSVYRPNQMTDFPSVAREWRRLAKEKGIGELYLLHVDVGASMEGIESDSAESGFDGSMAFPPHNHAWHGVDGAKIGLRPGFGGNGMLYAEMVDDSVGQSWRDLDPDHYPGAMVTFDNTARRQNASDFWYGSNPYRFRRWLSALATAVSDRPRDHRLVFINAWNEWAEAAVLEPTDRHGRSYLLAVRDVAFS